MLLVPAFQWMGLVSDQMPRIETGDTIRMKDAAIKALIFIYFLGQIATFGKLTFFDDYAYNWWNWLIVVPINTFLSVIWPIYWAILRPIFS